MQRWRDGRNVVDLLKVSLLVFITKDMLGSNKTDQALSLIRKKSMFAQMCYLLIPYLNQSRINEN